MKTTTENLIVGLLELDNKELRNLKHHLEQGTKIICGKDALMFAKPACGCPATLASSRRVPSKQARSHGTDKSWDAWERLSGAEEGNGFLEALQQAKPAEVRTAIKKALDIRGI